MDRRLARRIQKLPQLERVGGGRAFLVVIEIDIDLTTLLLPAPDSPAPVSQRVGTIMSLVTAAGAVASDVDKIGGAPPGRWGVVMIRNAERNVFIGQQPEDLRRVPARMTKFEAVAALVRQQPEKGRQPPGISLQLRRQLKQDRARLVAEQRQPVFQ